LAAFTFKIVELCCKESLKEREQYWLNWLFSLPPHFRFNFNPTAGSRLGSTHTQETKAKISNSKKGSSHTPEAKAKISAANRGSLNPMYGRVSAMAIGISLYTLEGAFVQSFSSQTAAAKFIGVNTSTISRAIKQNFLVKQQYRVFQSK